MMIHNQHQHHCQATYIHMHILLSSVNHKKKIISNTATCSSLLLEINLSETVETALSKLFLAVKAG